MITVMLTVGGGPGRPAWSRPAGQPVLCQFPCLKIASCGYFWLWLWGGGTSDSQSEACQSIRFSRPISNIRASIFQFISFFSDVSFGGRGGVGRACRLGPLTATTAEVLPRWQGKLWRLCVMRPWGWRLAAPTGGRAGDQLAQSTQH